ncbi:MAG: hypothetical protein LBQ05_02665, partial [Christensenellaceae bacterium]|nr:hypothetical protein [Christensenellaceae bacterium]
MTKLRIEGGNQLNGIIRIDGAKNAILPILAGCILVNGKVELHTVPKISDITNMLKILSHLGCVIKIKGDTVLIDATEIKTNVIPDEIAKKIRGSIFIMGALLARTGSVKMPYPGGCAIGTRPIDIHITALKQIGVRIKSTKTHIECVSHNKQPDGNREHFEPRNRRIDLMGNTPTREPRGKCEPRENKNNKNIKTIYLDFPSVGATENIILATVLRKGKYRIINAATEPEVTDLCNFLTACGGNIVGIGTKEITVTGVPELHGCEYTPMPDRINTGSYLIAAVCCGGCVTLQNVVPQHNGNLLEKLKSIGAKIKTTENTIQITYKKNTLPK